MGIVSKISEAVDARLKKSQRIINLKLPSYEDNYTLQLLLNKYKVYLYDVKSGKICLQKPIIKTIVDVVFWVLKCITFALECCFPIFIVSPSTVLSLLNELGSISYEFAQKASQKSVGSICQLSKHIRIRKNPAKKLGKIKKVICVPIDSNTSNEIRASVELIADLIESNRIVNCSLVILSKIALQSPTQEILDFYDDKEKNRFVSDFKRQFLIDILNENYVEASKFIREILNEDSIRVSEFEFIMQCLAFCYKNMNESEFVDIFSQSGLKINENLHLGKEYRFIDNAKQNKTLLRFCYSYLEQFYRCHPRINCDDLEITFKNIINKIKAALIAKDEYFSAVKLLSAYSSCEETVNNYIIASVHMEYIKNCINDECILLIKDYEQSTERAKLFLQLINLNYEETPDSAIVNSIFSYINKLENASPTLKLCFMYYLVNPVYKCNCCDNVFMNAYKKLLSSAMQNTQNNTALLCLFAIQYLLLYSTIEDVQLHKSNAKFASLMFDFINANRAFLENKKIYYKLIRSINGISVDDFSNNLSQMKRVKENVREYITENILFNINLGALHVYNGNAKAALNVYRDVKNDVLNAMPLSVRASYFNNRMVFGYLNNPTAKTAKSAVKAIIGYLKNNYKYGQITEEYIHLNLNLLIFQIISKMQSELTETLNYVRKLVENDKYYYFYFVQAEWLLCVMSVKLIDDEPLPESVFFNNKKSFFEQKRLIINEFTSKNMPATICDINKYLQNNLCLFENYEYFKRIETFSLVERWYE